MVISFIEQQLEPVDCSVKTQMQIKVAVEEIFVNIANYAYAPGTGNATVRVELYGEPTTVKISFIDGGIAFDPLAKSDTDITLSAEDRQTGGLGIYILSARILTPRCVGGFRCKNMILLRHKEANAMDNYVTGAVIRRLRERKKITQEELAERICVSGKAVSKWETGQGFPDISLIEPLSKALDISVIELLSGEEIRNRNKSSNMLKSKFYVCPICGNVVVTVGEAVISCCGLTLPPADSEPADNGHFIRSEIVEDEYYVTVDHPMNKEHYISFLAAVSDQDIRLLKLYPEGNAEARFKINRVKYLYAYCNRHGLFRIKAGSAPK